MEKPTKVLFRGLNIFKTNENTRPKKRKIRKIIDIVFNLILLWNKTMNFKKKMEKKLEKKEIVKKKIAKTKKMVRKKVLRKKVKRRNTTVTTRETKTWTVTALSMPKKAMSNPMSSPMSMTASKLLRQKNLRKKKLLWKRKTLWKPEIRERFFPNQIFAGFRSFQRK